MTLVIKGGYLWRMDDPRSDEKRDMLFGKFPRKQPLVGHLGRVRITSRVGIIIGHRKGEKDVKSFLRSTIRILLYLCMSH